MSKDVSMKDIEEMLYHLYCTEHKDTITNKKTKNKSSKFE